MGNPTHYAVDVPARCYALLDDYWEQVCNIKHPEFNGPLATTFLVALAGPMINFPFERVMRKNGTQNERHLSQRLADEIDRVFAGPRFDEAPFFIRGIWHYHYVLANQDFRVTALPKAVLEALQDDHALSAAEQVATNVWFSSLRHALAHSAIAYLDGKGSQTPDNPTEMIVFVSEDRQNRIVRGHHIFRIRRAKFRLFLDSWIAWLIN